MKNKLNFLLLLGISVLFGACSQDENDENKINHVGEKWNIVSVDYSLIDQSPTNQAVKSGTLANAGAFYFDVGKGSFDITIEGYHKEDVFAFSEDASTVTITTISQSVSGSSVSQNVIALSGDKNSDTARTLDGTVTKQTSTSQFILTATYALEKAQ